MEDGLTLRKAMELVERRAKARGYAEEDKLPPDEVRAMERAVGQQGWSNGQRLRDVIDMLEGVPVRTRPWPSYMWSPWSLPEDETDNRVCHVSVEALAEAMRMRRLERDGSPCWSTVEAMELLDEAMRCELEPLPATVGWAQATHAKRARERKRAAKACEG